MTLKEALKDWREPLTGGVSNAYHPDDKSADNCVDFTAIAEILGGQDVDFTDFCMQYERPGQPGVLIRRPGDAHTMSWDDLTSAAALSSVMAKRILEHGKKTGWMWDDKKLWRFPIFIPTVYAGAYGRLNILLQALAALAFIANCFEKYEETSGKKSLWIAQKALYGKGLVISLAIKLWRWAQLKRYKGGIREVFTIYFPPQQGVPHPFSVYAPGDFK